MDHRTRSPCAPWETGDGSRTTDEEDEALLLEDLREIAAKSLSRLQPVEDPFEALSRAEPFETFVVVPLDAARVERPRVPIHLVVAGALLVFLAASASPMAIAGFEKAPVTPDVDAIEEPFKPYPGLEVEEPEVVPPSIQETPAALPGPAEDAAGEEPVAGTVDHAAARPVVRAPRARRVETQGPAASPPVEPAPQSPRTSDGGLSAAAAVDHALGIDGPLPPQPEGEVLSQSPTRSEVLSALRGVSGAVARCGGVQGGRVSVDATIHGPTGRVSAVRVSGADAATSSCVDRAVRAARFHRFADESFVVRGFPFTLN